MIPFSGWKTFNGSSHCLNMPEFVLIDTKSRREFGPHDGHRFGEADVGGESELAQQEVRIVEHFTLGTGFVADGAVITSVRGFQRIRPQLAPQQVNLGLVKLLPQADPEQVAAALENYLPDDVEVLTRAEVLGGEVRHWVWETSIGLIFQLGVVVALVVGTAIVYQVLSSDVASHLPEYATLKAMGYGGGYLASVVLQQAVVLAVLGFVPGLAVSAALYGLTRVTARIPIDMTPARVLFVLALAVVMCTISGLGACGRCARPIRRTCSDMIPLRASCLWPGGTSPTTGAGCWWRSPASASPWC